MSTDHQSDVTATVAEFITSTAAVPEPAVDAARRLHAQTVQLLSTRPGAELADRVDVGTRDLLDPSRAQPVQWKAFFSVLDAVVADVDRGAVPSTGQADVPVVCAALAVADGATTEADLLAAIARGTELSSRLARCFSAARPDSPWDVTAVASRFGSVAAVACLLGLERSLVIAALGLAGGQSGGLTLALGDDNAALQLARAAFDAVEATLLAQRGFTASTEIVGGVGGAGDVLYGATDFDAVRAGLGRDWSSV